MNLFEYHNNNYGINNEPTKHGETISLEIIRSLIIRILSLEDSSFCPGLIISDYAIDSF